MTEHPGTVEMVDGETTEVVPASSCRSRCAGRPGPDGELRPVVRIVITAQGNEREIRQHGPDGELLRTTFGAVDA